MTALNSVETVNHWTREGGKLGLRKMMPARCNGWPSKPKPLGVNGEGEHRLIARGIAGCGAKGFNQRSGGNGWTWCCEAGLGAFRCSWRRRICRGGGWMGILHWQWTTHNSNRGSELSEHTAAKAAYTHDMGVSCCEYCRFCTRSFDQDIHKLFSLLTWSLLEIRDHSSLRTARAMLTKKTLWRMFFESVVSDSDALLWPLPLGFFASRNESASALSNAPTRNLNFSKSKSETVERPPRPQEKVEKKNGFFIFSFSFRI